MSGTRAAFLKWALPVVATVRVPRRARRRRLKYSAARSVATRWLFPAESAPLRKVGCVAPVVNRGKRPWRSVRNRRRSNVLNTAGWSTADCTAGRFRTTSELQRGYISCRRASGDVICLKPLLTARGGKGPFFPRNGCKSEPHLLSVWAGFPRGNAQQSAGRSIWMRKYANSRLFVGDRPTILGMSK